MTIADLVRTYLKNKPYTIEAIQSGIVNASSLARHVQKELGIRNYQAVKAAIRRYSQELEQKNNTIEIRAMPVLKGNKITLLDGVHVIISDKRLELENDAEVKIDSYYVYLTRKDMSRDIAKRQGSHIIKINENCSAIIVYSQERIEKVSGVVAFLASVLAAEDINVVELISCYTETIFVVNKDDALRTYQLLSELAH